MNPPALRIGIVSSFMPPHMGGLEVIADVLFKSYVAAGCDVRWVASRVPGAAAPRDGGRIRVRCWNGLERWLGVPWPIWGIGGIREVMRLARWADVIHVHDCLYLSSLLAVIISRWVGTPVLLSQHIGFAQYRSVFLRTVVSLAYHTVGRFVLRRATWIVLCTPAAEAYVSRLFGERPENATEIPYGIDTCHFKPPMPNERIQARRSLGLPESSRVVLFTGRLVEKKGVDLFIEVCRQRPEDYFLIVGDGPRHPPTIGNLRWVSFVPLDQMVRVYQAADVLLLPSRSEGFSLAVLEAMATGVPVILSNGLAFGKLLARDGACLLVDRASPAFGEALDQLAKTPSLGEALAARARELVVRQWDLEIMTSRYLALIHSLALGGPRQDLQQKSPARS